MEFPETIKAFCSMCCREGRTEELQTLSANHYHDADRDCWFVEVECLTCKAALRVQITGEETEGVTAQEGLDFLVHHINSLTDPTTIQLTE